MYTVDTLTSSGLFLEVAEAFSIVQDGAIIDSFLKVATPENRLAATRAGLFACHGIPVASKPRCDSVDSDVSERALNLLFPDFRPPKPHDLISG